VSVNKSYISADWASTCSSYSPLGPSPNMGIGMHWLQLLWTNSTAQSWSIWNQTHGRCVGECCGTGNGWRETVPPVIQSWWWNTPNMCWHWFFLMSIFLVNEVDNGRIQW